tara:strand:+ start:739 stop:1077 length:339 start_codon:yes stop_codon:yes gene_type:complete
MDFTIKQPLERCFSMLKMDEGKDYLLTTDNQIIEISPKNGKHYEGDELREHINDYFEFCHLSETHLFIGMDNGQAISQKTNKNGALFLRGRYNLMNDCVWGECLIVQQKHIR